MTPLKLIFIRHGESAGNIDKRKHFELADHAVPLTDLGRRQASIHMIHGQTDLGRLFVPLQLEVGRQDTHCT